MSSWPLPRARQRSADSDFAKLAPSSHDADWNGPESPFASNNVDGRPQFKMEIGIGISIGWVSDFSVSGTEANLSAPSGNRERLIELSNCGERILLPLFFELIIEIKKVF